MLNVFKGLFNANMKSLLILSSYWEKINIYATKLIAMKHQVGNKARRREAVNWSILYHLVSVNIEDYSQIF